MKKRLRKKLHRGEFQELGFFLKVKYAEMPDEEFDRFIDGVIDKIGSLGLECGGRFDVTELELFVTTGLVNTDEASKRQAVLDFMNSLPGVTSVEGSDFTDAWYDTKKG